MNYYGANQLAESFRTVRKNTIIIAEEIGEQQYSFQAAPETRTVAQLLVHIAVVPRIQEQVQGVERRRTLEGFDFPTYFGRIIGEEKTPRNKAQIITLLREEGHRFAKMLAGFSDDFLGEAIAMPPGMTPASKSRFEMLLGVKEHEMHHRGQLMLMERMVGVVPHLTREMQARFAAMASAKASA
ncbi:MAG TPA: DinB family protein [Bryobacteraceae bacterium]|nr:DinB family protein [Bryobacteraceae bacterium]